MDLFQILSSDERVVVCFDPAERVIYTWNQSLTLQAWKRNWRRSAQLEDRMGRDRL